MIDPKLLRSATEEVARNLARRGYRLDVQALNVLEEKRRHCSSRAIACVPSAIATPRPSARPKGVARTLRR